VSLKERVRQQGVDPVIAYYWFGEGRLLVPARCAGRLILVGAVPVLVSAGSVAVYARVSSAGQRSDLDWQVARVMTGWRVKDSRPGAW
jgi:predicted site-specific integrase-resolvase